MTAHEQAQQIIDSNGAANNAILLRRLESDGLKARVAEGRIHTGIGGLSIENLETQMLSFVPEGATAERWMVSWETCAYADGFPIPDLVTVSADSPNRALELAIATWLDVTFPALRGLCDPHFESADRQIALTSLTGGEFLSWKVFTGAQNFSGPGAAALRAHFEVNPDFFLVLGAVTDYLAVKRPHFIKIFLRYDGDELTVGCAIDGQKSAKAEAEMRAKLAGIGPDAQAFRPAGDVDFRVFFAIRATPAQPDPEMARTLAQHAAEQEAARKPSFRWPWQR